MDRGVNPPSLLDFALVDPYVALTFFTPWTEGVGLAALGEVVRAFADRADVAGVVLLSTDGLTIQSGGRQSLDPDSTAALAASFARQAGVLAETTGVGSLETVVLEGTRGLAVVTRVGTDWLVVIPNEGADAGALLYDLRCHRPALAALL